MPLRRSADRAARGPTRTCGSSTHPQPEGHYLRPTDEQLGAIEKFRSGRPLKIVAFAGAGKTSTLKFLSESRPARGLYLAFNRSIAAEARQKFPRNVDCRTTHSLAFRAVRPSYSSIAKLTRSVSAKQLAESMSLKSEIFGTAVRLDGIHQAHLLLGTVRRFCQSAAPAFNLDHVPTYGRLLGAPPDVIAAVRSWALKEAANLWARMTAKDDDIPLGHDGYLKLWALGRPSLAADYVLLDEAQDTNDVVLGVLRHQKAQIVHVGDRHQQVYEWRGAVNAMASIAGCQESHLTLSFRFGQAIADAASDVLATLGEVRRIRGNVDKDSVILAEGGARCVLARTNATVILEVLAAVDAGLRPCVVGGTKELRRLLSDVYELKAGKPATSPEFFGFANWQEVVAFADTEEGESVRMFVQLVEQHGEGKLWAAVKAAQEDEASADVILSTAHKAKGREWDSVRLVPDFASPRLGKHADAPSEVRLFYVAMTRAKKTLIVDPSLLALYGTDAWKTKGSEPRQPFRRPPPHGGRRPCPRGPSKRRPEIREVSPAATSSGGSGAMPQAPAKPPTPPSHVASVAAASPSPMRPKRRFWSRIARLFTQSSN